MKRLVSAIPLALLLLGACGGDSSGATGVEELPTTPYQLPDSVSVLPVFFVARGEATPSPEQAGRLMQQLRWSQESYAGWLGGTTFRIASEQPDVYESPNPLQHFRDAPESGSREATSELLAHYEVNRFTAPYIFLMVFANPRDRFPLGGGRPLNGGYNTGGGIIVLSTYALDSLPIFQSTLEHELGHSFGLPHVDVYGYDMEQSPSIMSFNPQHWTNYFEPAPEPGILIAEDVVGLSMNRRVFGVELGPLAEAVVDSDTRDPIWLGPMEIPGEPPYAIQATTTSGEAFGSSVQNTVIGEIKPNSGPDVTYDARTMWSSDVVPDGWANLELTFPFPVTLTRIAVHSQHSGLYHVARGIRVATVGASGPTAVSERSLAGADDSVDFDRHTSWTWRLEFQTGDTRMVVIRGLEFFDGDDEVFPPLVPYRGPN